MKIIVDGFGGDNSPTEVLKGCSIAARDYNVEIVVTGYKKILEKSILDNNIDLCDNVKFHDCPEIINIEDNPSCILNSKRNSSMGVGLELLAAGEGDAFVSGGSTASLVVGSSFIVKRIKGIKRSALAPIIPHDKGQYMLIDAGANIDCRPEMMLHFGIMGSIYMNKIMNIKSPKVGIVNVGSEEVKGTELYIESFNLLKKSNLNFIGNVEARDIPLGACDVVVSDGFTGNVILKLSEGLGKSISNNLKGIFKSGLLSNLSALMIKNKLKDFKKKMDYTEFGGACLMGIRKPVIKAHGSSNTNAFKNAIRQACSFVKNDVILDIKGSISDII